MDQRQASVQTRPRPLRRDAERNRLAILAAARTVFARHGLEASLDEVAREAGLGVGTVYRRFPNREALVDALFADVVDEITRIVDRCVAEPRAWDGLRHFMGTMLELQARDKGLRDIMVTRHAPTPDEDVLRDRIRPGLDVLVERAQQQGDMRTDLTPTDIGVLQIAALGAAEFTAGVAPDLWRRYLAIMLEGVRARPGQPAEPLSRPPLDDRQLDECMIGWKYGSRSPAPTPPQHNR